MALMHLVEEGPLGNQQSVEYTNLYIVMIVAIPWIRDKQTFPALNINRITYDIFFKDFIIPEDPDIFPF